MSTRARIGLVLLLSLVVATALAVVVTRPGGNTDPAGGSRSTPGAGTPSVLRELTAAQAGQAFLTAYVDPDGRVVRRDQGGDTVSEGQAYAMLVAVATGDRARFAATWSWTEEHLMRTDGTLSWRWQDGRVVDQSSAADADLDAARALVLAGRRFDDAGLLQAGVDLGDAVLDVETVRTDLGRILVAGDWARPEPHAYNPSYASPAAFAVLREASGDSRWRELEKGSAAVTQRLLDSVDLPPDWAQVHHDGRIEPMPGPAGRGDEGVRYSYDATRLPLRYAESCRPADRALAARLAVALDRFPGHAAARDLGGQPLTTDESVVAAAARAAVAAAAGDPARVRAELLATDHQQQLRPTYYGGAWNALGRLLLTDTGLGGCPPLDHGASAAPTSRTGGPEPIPDSSAVRVTSVTIGSIGLRTHRLETLDLTRSGELAAPRDPDRAGWYAGGTVPGEIGPAVIAGHVDSTTGPAVFFDLRRVERHATIVVGLSDGSSTKFRVDQVLTVPKKGFPTEQVYGPTPDAQLRLITCGGPYDRVVGSYLDNTVVFATRVR